MRPRIAAVLASLAAAAAWFAGIPDARAGGGPAETVVLVNAGSEDGKRVADHYAKARSIPASHVFAVKCTATLDVPMADFVRDVVDPLRTMLAERGLEDRVRFVVMTQGMPIRASTPSGYVSTAAALALLHTGQCGLPQTGLPTLRPTPYTGTMSQMVQAPRVETTRFLHVTALLSTTADEAIALVDRSVASDGTAPGGALFVYQDASGNAATRNGAYDASRRQIEALGATTEHVPAGADKATGRKRVMGYMAGGSYSALTPDGVKSNEYLPGAICDHLQSYGSVPENFGADPKRFTQFPVTHMVRAGVTAVHGAVAEPYTIAFPDPDLFTAYVQGATVAETFDARIPTAYWMNLVLGDPLCAPYAVRPKVTLDGAPSGTWSGPAKFTARAPGAKRIAVYVDGTEAAAGDTDHLDVAIDTAQFADGPHQVLVQATGADTWEARGWTSVTAAFGNPALRIVARPSRCAGSLRVPLSRAPTSDEKPVLALEAGGAPVPGTSRVEGSAIVFTPAGALPPGPLAALATGMGDPVRWDISPAATSVTAAAPDAARAGDDINVLVTLRGSSGTALAGWKGRVELRVADPPVRIASIDAEAAADGTVAIPARFTRAGALALRVVLPLDGVETAVKVSIASGPPAVATSPQGAVPLGQATDVDVLVQDAYGNRCDAFEGELRIAFPGDPFAVVPGPVQVTKADRGRAVFRDVVLTRAGNQPLVITDAAGKQWSQPGEGLAPAHTALRRWLAAPGPAGKDAGAFAAEDPAKGADVDGCVAGARLWRRYVARADDVSMPVPGGKDGDAVAFVTFVKAISATKVRLLGAGASRLVILLDGKEVFDGVPKMADVRGKREPIAEFPLPEGMHRLTVVAARKDRAAAFSLELDDGAGKHADQVVVAGAPGDDAPEKFVASGRVRRGGAGTKVVVKGADGAEHTATPGDGGIWFVEGLPAGDIEVRAQGQRPFQPPVRKATIAGRHAVDLDFVCEDKQAPTVKLDLGTTKFAKSLVLEPAVEDDDSVREVRLLVDGVEMAKASAAPWRLAADVNGKSRGKHEVVVVAVDPTGNEGRSAPLAVTLIDDAKGPVVKVAGLANNAELKKKAEVTVTATDDLPIASVRFRLDGKDLGAPRTAAPYTAEVDPKGLAEGTHSLAVTARDLDGNETMVEVKFRIR